MIGQGLAKALRLGASGIALGLVCAVAHAQLENFQTGRRIQVTPETTRIEMSVGTTTVLEFDHKVPEVVIENQLLVRATPLDATKILLVATQQPGISAISVSDENSNIQTIEIHVVADVRKLEATLETMLPESNIRAIPANTAVILTGVVSRADHVTIAMDTARLFFPVVINNLSVYDAQLVAVEVKVYEVSRTKLRQLGIDWSFLGEHTDLVVRGAGISTVDGNNLLFDGERTTVAFSIFDDSNQLSFFLDALAQRSAAKLLDRPVLVANSGRPAEFLSGGEIPFEINQGLGNTTIEFRPFGTKLDVIPFALGQGQVRLEIRAEVSEPSAELATTGGTPGFRVRRVNTGVEMKFGHTLALAGDFREETEAETRGIPFLMDAPGIGKFFRRVEESTNELELVILLTPRYISEVDPSCMPPIGPGQSGASPSDCELYDRGHLEVPRCGPDCPPPHGLHQQPEQFPYDPAMQGAPVEPTPPAPGTAPQQLPPVSRYPINPNPNPNWPAAPAPTTPTSSPGFGFPTSNQPGALNAPARTDSANRATSRVYR
jgi:pilus assembly protein CpaC